MRVCECVCACVCTHAVCLQHPYVAMDTEFPGVVARPYGTFRSHTDYLYQTLKCNVDLLRLIQVRLGLRV